MPAFKGFPPEALEFLRELEANNDREWFKANRARYDEHLGGARAGAGRGPRRPRALAPVPSVERHALHPRPPIKEQLGLAVGYEGAGGYYVELSLDGLLVAGGPLPPRARPARPDPARDRRRAHAAPLTRAIGRARDAGLAVNEPELVRAPRGYSADHPRLDLLRCKSLTVSRRHAIGPWLHRPKAGSTIRSELDAAGPLVRWVRERVGPSQRAVPADDQSSPGRHSAQARPPARHRRAVGLVLGAELAPAGAGSS